MGFGTCEVRCVCMWRGTDSREKNVHNARESREEGMDKLGKGEIRIRSDEKKKQSKNEMGLRSTFNRFEART